MVETHRATAVAADDEAAALTVPIMPHMHPLEGARYFSERSI